MAAKFMQLVLTPAVQTAQERYFGKHQVVASAPERDPFTADEAAFIAHSDSFYMATTNSDGWPYLQHRGGPDIGSQYRSAIFFTTPEQESAARASAAKLEESGQLSGSLTTEIALAAPFYAAEEYHQKYHVKHGGSCRIL